MNFFSDLVDLVLPASCVCCARPGSVWCSPCQPAAVAAPVTLSHGPPTTAAGEYADELRTVLLHYKERGARQLVSRLADYLSEAVDVAARAAVGPGDLVALVPIPSRRSAARERGGDHVLRLARLVGRHAGVPVLSLLQLVGPVADSAGLTPVQRQANLAGRMRAGPPPQPRTALRTKLIIVDDIVTTGATLAEADRALAGAGWSHRAAAVIAATRLRSSSGQTAEAARVGRRPDRAERDRPGVDGLVTTAETMPMLRKFWVTSTGQNTIRGLPSVGPTEDRHQRAPQENRGHVIDIGADRSEVVFAEAPAAPGAASHLEAAWILS